MTFLKKPHFPTEPVAIVVKRPSFWKTQWFDKERRKLETGQTLLRRQIEGKSSIVGFAEDLLEFFMVDDEMGQQAGIKLTR